jgi:hypothetical protein
MARLKALCSDFSKAELPHSDVYLPTPNPRPAVVTPPIVHRLEESIAKTGKLFMVPGSTPIDLDDGLVRSQSLNLTRRMRSRLTMCRRCTREKSTDKFRLCESTHLTCSLLTLSTLLHPFLVLHRSFRALGS